MMVIVANSPIREGTLKKRSQFRQDPSIEVQLMGGEVFGDIMQELTKMRRELFDLNVTVNGLRLRLRGIAMM